MTATELLRELALAESCLDDIRDYLATQPCQHGPAGSHPDTSRCGYTAWIECCLDARTVTERERCGAVLTRIAWPWVQGRETGP